MPISLLADTDNRHKLHVADTQLAVAGAGRLYFSSELGGRYGAGGVQVPIQPGGGSCPCCGISTFSGGIE
jgi:hypothetical protein